jgi:hypothetical protein
VNQSKFKLATDKRDKEAFFPYYLILIKRGRRSSGAKTVVDVLYF